MAIQKGEIGIYGVLKNDTPENVIAYAEQIKDTNENKNQQTINSELRANLATIEETLSEKVDKKELYGDDTFDVGNAVLVNKTTLEKISVKPDELSNYSPDKYEAIGVIAIPSSHDVYGTGECGVMALRHASVYTPDTGTEKTSYGSSCWGSSNTNYPELIDYNACSSYGNQNTWTPVQLNSEKPYLPSDQDPFGEELINPNGEKSSWYYFQNSSHHAPSPYNEDGSRNPDYYDTSIGVNNALSDFAGKVNTEFLCSKATKQKDWRTAATISNSDLSGYHPAACACWRYHTIGTNQGDWYLPAEGELGYCCVRYKLINGTIDALQSWSGKIYSSLETGPYYWSSSEYSTYGACCMHFQAGRVLADSKYSTRVTTPFIRLTLASPAKFYNKEEVNELLDTKISKEELPNYIKVITEEELDNILI